jgi:hypothetical protein
MTTDRLVATDIAAVRVLLDDESILRAAATAI